MMLTIEQAATRLGKSARQVRYLVLEGRLPAQKLGGRWLIDAADLPLSDEQQQAMARKERQLRAVVEEGLGIGEGSKRYSVRDLKAFQLGLPLFRELSTALPDAHPARMALQRMLEWLALGCHRFDRNEKATAYRQARDEASQAVCALLLDPALPAQAEAWITTLEQEIMAALAGLLRRMERKR